MVILTSWYGQRIAPSPMSAHSPEKLGAKTSAEQDLFCRGFRERHVVRFARHGIRIRFKRGTDVTRTGSVGAKK